MWNKLNFGVSDDDTKQESTTTTSLNPPPGFDPTTDTYTDQRPAPLQLESLHTVDGASMSSLGRPDIWSSPFSNPGSPVGPPGPSPTGHAGHTSGSSSGVGHAGSSSVGHPSHPGPSPVGSPLSSLSSSRSNRVDTDDQGHFEVAKDAPQDTPTNISSDPEQLSYTPRQVSSFQNFPQQDSRLHFGCGIDDLTDRDPARGSFVEERAPPFHHDGPPSRSSSFASHGHHSGGSLHGSTHHLNGPALTGHDRTNYLDGVARKASNLSVRDLSNNNGSSGNSNSSSANSGGLRDMNSSTNNSTFNFAGRQDVYGQRSSSGGRVRQSVSSLFRDGESSNPASANPNDPVRHAPQHNHHHHPQHQQPQHNTQQHQGDMESSSDDAQLTRLLYKLIQSQGRVPMSVVVNKIRTLMESKPNQFNVNMDSLGNWTVEAVRDTMSYIDEIRLVEQMRVLCHGRGKQQLNYLCTKLHPQREVPQVQYVLKKHHHCFDLKAVGAGTWTVEFLAPANVVQSPAQLISDQAAEQIRQHVKHLLHGKGRMPLEKVAEKMKMADMVPQLKALLQRFPNTFQWRLGPNSNTVLSPSASDRHVSGAFGICASPTGDFGGHFGAGSGHFGGGGLLLSPQSNPAASPASSTSNTVPQRLYVELVPSPETINDELAFIEQAKRVLRGRGRVSISVITDKIKRPNGSIPLRNLLEKYPSWFDVKMDGRTNCTVELIRSKQIVTTTEDDFVEEAKRFLEGKGRVSISRITDRIKRPDNMLPLRSVLDKYPQWFDLKMGGRTNCTVELKKPDPRVFRDEHDFVRHVKRFLEGRQRTGMGIIMDNFKLMGIHSPAAARAVFERYPNVFEVRTGKGQDTVELKKILVQSEKEFVRHVSNLVSGKGRVPVGQLSDFIKLPEGAPLMHEILARFPATFRLHKDPRTSTPTVELVVANSSPSSFPRDQPNSEDEIQVVLQAKQLLLGRGAVLVSAIAERMNRPDVLTKLEKYPQWFTLRLVRNEWTVHLANEEPGQVEATQTGGPGRDLHGRENAFAFNSTASVVAAVVGEDHDPHAVTEERTTASCSSNNSNRMGVTEEGMSSAYRFHGEHGSGAGTGHQSTTPGASMNHVRGGHEFVMQQRSSMLPFFEATSASGGDHPNNNGSSSNMSLGNDVASVNEELASLSTPHGLTADQVVGSQVHVGMGVEERVPNTSDQSMNATRLQAGPSTSKETTRATPALSVESRSVSGSSVGGEESPKVGGTPTLGDFLPLTLKGETKRTATSNQGEQEEDGSTTEAPPQQPWKNFAAIVKGETGGQS